MDQKSPKHQFNQLARTLLGQKGSAPETSTDKLDGIVPSKRLPATGLKRNTQEWKDAHPDEAAEQSSGGGADGRRPRRSRRGSSSSSIPSQGAKSEDGGNDERTEEERSQAQEGPRGRGPGKHEEEIPTSDENQRREGGRGWLSDHAGGRSILDSPEDESSPKLNGHGHLENGWTESPASNHSDLAADQPRSYSFIPAESDQPPSRSQDMDQSRAPKDPQAHTRGDRKLSGHEDSAADADRSGAKRELSEVFEGRDGERERKLTDETGRRPDGLQGVKEEEKPGPRNEIVLDPRITHMQYHQQKEYTPAGIVRGPVLKVSPDGESENPPGQTPAPSRTASYAPHGDDSDDQSRSMRHQAAYERGMGSSTTDGSWRGALDPGAAAQDVQDTNDGSRGGGMRRKKSNSGRKDSAGSTRSARNRSRWSSFRQDGAASEREMGAHEEEEGSDMDDRDHRERPAGKGDGQGAKSQSRQNSRADNSGGQRKPSAAASSTSTSAPAPAGSPQAEAQKRWSMLRSRVLPSRNSSGPGPTPTANKTSALAHTAIASLPVTTELMAGQLPVMILKTWLDRDEDGNRAVPVLLGNLRFRVGDSVGLKEGASTGKEMFKLECEYGDGAVRWVIYRELRDFLSLHTHYKAANFGTNVPGIVRTSRHVDIPEFPKMSIPYLKTIQGRRGERDQKPMSKAEYAQAGRDALQQYLVALIRAVIFRPESNRLCKFFELSSLTLTLAPRGGFQGKAGFLKIPGSNASRRANQPGLTPTSWIHNRSPKWFIVRDSYFVATDGPEATEYYDVFLIDEDFSIERPKRVYRAGLHFVTGHSSIRPHRRKDSTAATIQANGVDTENPMAREMLINQGEGSGNKGLELDERDGDGAAGEEADASHHTFFIVNSQRRLKLVAKNARQMHQFIVSMERIAAQCIWAGRNRFDSFAPLRVNCSAQWLVDGRDYFWNLSRAINMAKERIYIHDWWISPEIYLRRPGNERYRLDNLLKRKAEDGVKIFIIVYAEVSDKTTPVNSTYTKRTLVGLHPNIMVQRSPSHFQTGTFYWSHHEKMCVIDETIAFMGGLDLCFGRWDTSQHVLTDEDFTEPNGPNGPVWHGKDYANERVAEYSALDKPFEDMFDRNKVPRMPWHDVGLQIVGHPARDLCRHFVQRWNLLIRTKNHKRRYPFLLPPPDFVDRELDELKLRGTCEVQICRSVGPWSMGTLEKIEHSVQNAYIKSIELSEHFVYIENQFFITSTIVDGITIENGIGDALVDRIIKAHKEKTPWRACIVIPLLPGYTFPIDSSEASSVRLILECQNRTICRGTNSIFSRLRLAGIDPDEYITFFSLRGWAKFKSGTLTTEQVYIHGKTMVVDDRLAIIGSANINERSQRGDRDSELVAVIRDTDMIDGTMAGKPFKVGRFAHTLRVRLMREHVGIDVDSIEEDQLMSREPIANEDEVEIWDPDHEQEDGEEEASRGITKIKARTAKDRFARTVQSGVSSITKGVSENMATRTSKISSKITRPFANLVSGDTIAHHNIPGTGQYGDESERQDYEGDGVTTGFAGSIVPTLEEKTIFERRPSASHANGQPLFDLLDEESERRAEDKSPDVTDVAEAEVPQVQAERGDYVPEDKKQGGRGVPVIQTRDDRESPERFGEPANATEGDEAPPTQGNDRTGNTSSKQEHAAIQARKTLRKHLNAKVGMNAWSMPTPTPIVDPNRFHDPLDVDFWKDMWTAVAVHNTEIYRKVFRCIPDDLVTSWAQYKAFASHGEKFNMAPVDVSGPGTTEPPKVTHDGPGTHGAGGGGSGGGTLGQENAEGDHASSVRESDVVDGKPRDTLHAVTSAITGSDPRNSHLNLSREKSRLTDGINAGLAAGGGAIGGGGSGGGGGGAGPGGSGGGDAVLSPAPQPETKAPALSTSTQSSPSPNASASTFVESENPRPKASGPNEAWQDWEKEEMEELLGEIRGHLVIYPTRFLEAEDAAHNFLFNSDKIMPLPIFN